MLKSRFAHAALVSAFFFGCAIAAAADFPVGTLTLKAHDSARGMRWQRCPAVAVTADAVLTRASCFDLLRENEATHAGDFDGRFEMQASDGATFIASVRDFDWRSDYAWVRCDLSRWREACDKASQYCERRFDGMQRDVCSANRAFYAHTFLPGHSNNLALVYLNRRVPSKPAALATKEVAALPGRAALDVVTPGAAQQRPGVITINAGDVVVESFTGITGAALAYVQAPDGQRGVVGIPSHFANLPYDAALPVDFVFSRVDAAIDWIDVALQLACRDRRRLDCDLPTRLRAPQPHVPPEPALPPEPVPQPRPVKPRPSQPTPTPFKPAPQPVPPVAQPPPSASEPAPPAREMPDASGFTASTHTQGCAAADGGWMTLCCVLALLITTRQRF